jgi:uncharacterized membrane protein (DUF4010 family)
MNDEQLLFYRLGVALAIGLLVGIERGWVAREAREGERIAGVRTYGLIGLLGGVAGLLTDRFGALVLGLMFIGLAVMLTTVYITNRGHGARDIGITSLITGLVIFMLGATAVIGKVELAVTATVIMTLLLSYKPVIHRWVGALNVQELHAGIQLLLISVVLLPILPDQGYGPWQALNPYQLWWMVVLIATISFVGYFAIRIAGAKRGTVFLGLFGGLASSTMLTLHFSRLSRSHPALPAPLMAMGILLACGTMYPRLLLVVTLVKPALFMPLLWPIVVMASLTYLPTLIYSRRARSLQQQETGLSNPLDLKSAIGFGLLLAAVMLLVKYLQESFGDLGVLSLAAASGFADVDAITLSLARMTPTDLTPPFAVFGIVIAAASNSLAKTGIAAIVGGRQIGIYVGVPLLLGAAAGLMTTWSLLG